MTLSHRESYSLSLPEIVHGISDGAGARRPLKLIAFNATRFPAARTAENSTIGRV